MPDVIQLLSDHIANQIAAGEVIQRPSSAVKELLENSIDAGATEIQLIIKDAGKELIQVVDNGKGMSPTDARMSFERHATSKIRSIEDLFTIRTMGFRGEALASIAAVTQVEMKTRQAINETGTRIIVEGTEVKLQEACATSAGTSISVKNLFYNVPARRNFLKSNVTEYRNILDEFTRVAMAYPQVAFRLFNNGAEQFHLSAGSLKQRIIGLLGNSYDKKLVPVEEKTDVLDIYGFIGKPEAATRTRGMQFFFINNRFIRNAYLHHALVKAYEGLIDKDSFPFYVLYLGVDPGRVDVNVHPTKQEVKFEDDRMMYAYLNAAVKHALARNNIAPSIDFTLDAGINNLPAVNLQDRDRSQAEAQKGYLYNVFTDKGQAHKIEPKDSLKQWKDLYEIAKTPLVPIEPQQQPISQLIPNSTPTFTESVQPTSNVLLIQGDMLATTVKSGLLLMDIKRAQERIWYERLLENWNNAESASQQVLFPLSYEVSPQDALLLNEVLSDLAKIGFDIRPFGQNTFVVQGVPAGMPSGEEKNMLDDVLEQLKHEATDSVDKRTEQLLAHMARRLARNKHSVLQPDGRQALIDELFACSQPEYTPDGKKVFVMLKKEDLEGLLG